MQLSGTNVLITGGGGFIGSHLAEQLLKNNANVTVLDRFSIIGKSNIELFQDQLDTIDCDIRSFESLAKIHTKFDLIFHLAALASPRSCESDPATAFETNVEGTYNVLRFAKMNAKRVIFPSSAQLYGREPKYLPIDENHPLDIESSVYNVTKRIGEHLCHDFRALHGLDTRVVRLFNTFGPRQGLDYLIPTMIHQAFIKRQIELWNGEPTRDFNYVTNTVEALIKVGEYDGNLEPLNIGYGEEIRISELAQNISQYLNCPVHFLNKPVSGSLRLRCNNSKIKNLLNWEPKVSFEEGISKTIKAYEMHFQKSK